MFKSLLVAMLLVVALPAVESEAGLFFRQGRGLFPNARGIAGRMESRQMGRQQYRGRYGYSPRFRYGYRCASCNKTRATAVLVS